MKIVNILPKNDMNIKYITAEIPDEDFYLHPEREESVCANCKNENYPACKAKCGPGEED